jgi:hypothetical protein
MKYDPHAVYLMKNRWSEANYKLGFSRRPEIRKVEVDHDYQVDPHLLAVCWFPTERDARAAETIWHTRLACCRTDDHGGREWFSLNSTQVDEFVQWCSRSLSFENLLDGLFKGSFKRTDIRLYNDSLFTSIPGKMKQPKITIWLNPLYCDASHNSIKNNPSTQKKPTPNYDYLPSRHRT